MIKGDISVAEDTKNSLPIWDIVITHLILKEHHQNLDEIWSRLQNLQSDTHAYFVLHGRRIVRFVVSNSLTSKIGMV